MYTNINWKKFLNKNNISNNDWYIARLLATQWDLEKINPNVEKIETKISGEPKDLKLYKLGKQFYNYVNEKNQKKALIKLIQVENRITQLANKK